MIQKLDLGGMWRLAEVKFSKPEFDRLTVTRLNTLIESGDFSIKLDKRRDWLAGQVPGDNFQDLLRAKRIPHPFHHMNYPKLQWMEERVWCYKKTFYIPENTEGRIDLVFEGLDTFATVFLNGKVIGKTNNMFHPWRFDITGQAEKGKANELRVVFHPWQIHTRGKDVSDQWAPFAKDRVWVRRAQMESGWDWGPRIVLSGIWRPVRLEVVPSVRISSWNIRTVKADGKQALVEAEVELDRISKKPVRVEVCLRNGGQKITGSAITAGSKVALHFKIPEPKLWWPRNLGKPNLYEVTIQASVEEKIADRIKAKTGIRTVKLLQEPQGNGCKSFTFVVNGKKTYMGGVNWIPAHSFISSVTPEQYRERLQAAVDANMNTIRIWGGGIYEDEAFYNLCDEMGLMVWQDFMFACGFYPGNDPEFMANVENEFNHVILRLRTHPSIVLWNGNNENQWLDGMANWKKKNRTMPDLPIYHQLLPKLTRQLDNNRPYWPSSPFGGNDHNDWRQGPHHSYKVWVGCRIPRKFGECPNFPKSADLAEIRHYKHYADIVPRFVSEFSAMGVPYKKTISQYLSGPEMKLTNKAMVFRNKSSPEYNTLKSSMTNITGWAKDYNELELKTQFAQARTLEFGITHHREHLWQCSGSLVWQLNDCWPGFSWSLLDYDLLPKPAYFTVKRCFAPLLLSIKQTEGNYRLWAVNTSGKPWQAQAKITVQTFDGKLLGQAQVKIDVAHDHSKQAVSDLLNVCGLSTFDLATTFIKAEIIRGPQTAPAWFVADPVQLKLPPAKVKTVLNVKKTPDGFKHEVTLESTNFAYFVGIIPPDATCKFEDNFINLDPNGQATIMFTSPNKHDLKHLKLRGYNI
jgi:beta-mannosidase